MKSASRTIDLKKLTITDDFWKKEMELVRNEVLPYEWNALNDQVPGADPSFCMHNFRAAGKLLREKKEANASEKPEFTDRGIARFPLPGEEAKEDEFYGFVFQDTDFYKWVEAAAYSLTQHPDPALEKQADDAIDVAVAAQDEDGYLDTYFIINGRAGSFTNMRDYHELYVLGHLIEAAVAYFEATGKRVLLDAAIRYADYVDSLFGPEEDKKKGYPGHEIAEMALIRLYEVTGEERYLRLSEFFVRQRGQEPLYFETEEIHPKRGGMGMPYYQSHKPILEQEEAVGHAVRAMYYYCGAADVARYTKDGELQAAVKRLWDSATKEKMFITGSIGSARTGEAFTFPFDLPNDTSYNETCAAIGLMFFARRMLQAEVKGEYADVMERALYNGVLSGMDLNGKRFFYVNPLEVVPEASHRDPGKQHVKPVRQKWFGCACCPPNLARLLSSVGAYAFTENDTTLFNHIYMSSIYEKIMADRTVTVESSVDYSDPTRWKVSYTVRNGGDGFCLALRLPYWTSSPAFEGLEAQNMVYKDGYFYIKKDWGKESSFTLEMKTPVRFIQADSRVREDIGKVAVTKGPFVFCMEEADNGADMHLIRFPRTNTVKDVKTVRGEVAGVGTEELLMNGLRIGAEKEKGLYFDLQEETVTPVTLRYIPYYMWANRGENEMQVWTRIR